MLRSSVPDAKRKRFDRPFRGLSNFVERYVLNSGVSPKKEANQAPAFGKILQSLFSANPRFQPLPSISSRFGDRDRPLCSLSSRSVGIEPYPGSERRCRRLGIRYLL
jgi:hypothetical protein